MNSYLERNKAQSTRQLDPQANQFVPQRNDKDNMQNENKKEICATIDSRIETVTENLKKEFSIMKGGTQTALAGIKATMLAHTEAIKEVEGALTQHSDDIARLQTEVARLTAETAKLSDKCEDLEGRSRRNNIRMIGVPEGKEGTRPREFISQLLTTSYPWIRSR
ncbi:hypothetical protein KUCAC02_016894 [Chaenocephalus aceratus]|nr:hypothetical protein KUCAC02_016894 [Chaenocephalus aceratus]